MPENLLTLLNYLLLALLYLFFARVVWVVWSEVRVTRAGKAKAGQAAPVAGPGAAAAATAAVARPAPPVVPVPAATSRRDKDGKAKGPAKAASMLVVLQPPERAGATYPLMAEMTIGRAAGCHVSVPSDTYASNLHARVYQADGLTFVEDLGSTNGTFVNGARISGATALRAGDRVQAGATLLELE